jgi:hypothetical protein
LAANKAATPKNKPISIPPWAIVLVLALAAGLAGFLYLERLANRPPPPPPPLTAEARAYVRYLKLSDVEIICVFYDAYGQVVLRERVPILSTKTGGVAPGETKAFRLPFDNLPESWNRMMPQLVIARIDFE